MKKRTMKRSIAMGLAVITAAGCLTGCGGSAAAVTTKNIVEALNDYTTLWNGLENIQFSAGSNDKAQKIAVYIENHPLEDPDKMDEYVQKMAEECGLNGEPSNGTAYLFGTAWMGDKLLNKDNRVAYYATQLLGAFQRVIDGEEDENCYVLSDMSRYDFAEKKNVKVGTATAKVDPEDASAKVLVVIYEVPVEEAGWTPPKL